VGGGQVEHSKQERRKDRDGVIFVTWAPLPCPSNNKDAASQKGLLPMDSWRKNSSLSIHIKVGSIHLTLGQVRGKEKNGQAAMMMNTLKLSLPSYLSSLTLSLTLSLSSFHE
jgi:hypothetical protein